jgi:hypothetical protein
VSLLRLAFNGNIVAALLEKEERKREWTRRRIRRIRRRSTSRITNSYHNYKISSKEPFV